MRSRLAGLAAEPRLPFLLAGDDVRSSPAVVSSADIVLTPVDDYGGWWAKREDRAGYTGPEYPSGSKVRQYLAMSGRQPGVPMIVGCSAGSAMQIYVAAAAYQTGVPGIVYTAARRARTAATEYAARLGAEIAEVRPGYLSYCRVLARARSKEIGEVVRWDPAAALRDAAAQCANLPAGVRRVVVPTGSGLTCAGILAGLAAAGRTGVPILAAAVSGQAGATKIIEQAQRLTDRPLPLLHLARTPSAYDDWAAARLPDGTILDPYYAAKALSYVVEGDCFWIPGVRPIAAMPPACRAALGI